ncbi:MAG: YceI family protein [Cyclobacteriaceae bacterium]
MKKLMPIILTLLVVANLNAQTVYRLDNTSSDMSVLGTSTLHDWESDVQEVSGSVSLTAEGNQLKELADLSITVIVKSIKSGKSGMDKNTYNALNEKEFPNITYELTSVENMTDKDVRTVGRLSISGTTNSKELISQYVINEASISFNGAITFNMTEFNIDPPTALMGTIKTGDEVTIEYDVIFSKN